ncbi:MAG: hypothetical protein GY789_08475 [Hyphomicrobiales bacterium]|nr:hypothetical protein [Hyphomicrobiales bacterium]MCP4997727.1 hypothetical protein [Hyphomicrobiales bacterium]
MSTRNLGLVLFSAGGLYIFCASWLAMWWLAPFWRNAPADSIEETTFAFGGPVFMIIALSVPVGIVLASLGMALYSDFGQAGWKLNGLLAAGLIFIGASVLVVPTMAYYPNMFGMIGGAIVIVFLLTLWYWARVRIELGTQSQLADVFQLFSYLFFYLTATTTCALLGNPFGGLFFPETILREASLPYYYSMGTKIAMYLALGWLCNLVSQYARYRVAFTKSLASADSATHFSGTDQGFGPDSQGT